MKFKILPILFVYSIMVMVQISCENKSEYEQLIAKELRSGSGIEIDSLFMGYYFGMTQKEFFEHSWKLNQQRVITNGADLTIRKKVKELKAAAVMHFYPKFYNGRIHQMRIVYNYNAWAPWNKDLWSGPLKKDLINYYENKLDTEFQEVTDAQGNQHTVSIDGNREIKITALGNEAVEVLYRDLRIESNLQRLQEQTSNF